LVHKSAAKVKLSQIYSHLQVVLDPLSYVLRSHEASNIQNSILLLNDHDMGGSSPVVAMSSSNLKTPSGKLAVSRIDIGSLLDVGSCYCGPCYKVSLGSIMIEFESVKEALYHMKAK